MLAAQSASLPQPDQLCGPFAACAALHALDADVPSVVDLALAAGTAVWPRDVPSWRPAGVPCVRTGWDRLPPAPSPAASGTTAAGLARAVEALTGAAVVPAAGGPVGSLAALLLAVAGAGHGVGVVANLLTHDLGPEPVGHFVVLWAYDRHEGRVAVADSYAELGRPGLPAGCRWLRLSVLAEALVAAPGRGLLLMVGTAHAATTHALVVAAGLSPAVWAC